MSQFCFFVHYARSIPLQNIKAAMLLFIFLWRVRHSSDFVLFLPLPLSDPNVARAGVLSSSSWGRTHSRHWARHRTRLGHHGVGTISWILMFSCHDKITGEPGTLHKPPTYKLCSLQHKCHSMHILTPASYKWLGAGQH